MNKDNQEIEIKIKVKDKEALVKKLIELGAQKSKSIQSRDVMYDDGKKFFDSGKVLRLRSYDDGHFKLTYKEPLGTQENEHMLERTEIETLVMQGIEMDLILKKLGFEPYRIKEKISEHYMLEGLVVELHHMPFTGDYMEIESDAATLEKFLPKIGYAVTDGINKDYTALFMDFCDLNSLAFTTPQTFEEEKKFLQKQ